MKSKDIHEVWGDEAWEMLYVVHLLKIITWDEMYE